MAEPQIEPQFTAFFSKLARVTYFQAMLIEILRVRAFQTEVNVDGTFTLGLKTV